MLSAHEILRTTFAQVPGMRTHQQVISEMQTLALTVTETGAPLQRDSRALQSALETAAQPAFDLQHGPLVRATLVCAPEGSALILTAAAACLDTASMLLVLGELAAAYGGDAEQEPLQYADYAEWRHELLNDTDPDADAGPREPSGASRPRARPRGRPCPPPRRDAMARRPQVPHPRR